MGAGDDKEEDKTDGTQKYLIPTSAVYNELMVGGPRGWSMGEASRRSLPPMSMETLVEHHAVGLVELAEMHIGSVRSSKERWLGLRIPRAGMSLTVTISECSMPQRHQHPEYREFLATHWAGQSSRRAGLC